MGPLLPNRASRIPILAAGLWLSVALAGCTAWRVVTHAPATDPVKAPAGTYTMDPRHWSIVFDVDHLGYSRVVIRFDRAKASLALVPEAPENSRVSATIEAASVDTNDAELDRMLSGPDMFDAARYPDIRFDSRELRRTGPATGDMTGDLTVHGRTVPVTLAVTFNGSAPNPLTREDTVGFSAHGSFSRSQLGLTQWYPAVGDEVRVSIQAEFVRSSGTSP